jgi:hypothetical protein
MPKGFSDTGTTVTVSQQVRDISAAQLARLGMSQLAYIRPVTMHGNQAFAIHGADGTPMAVAPDRDLASAAIEEHDMVQVLVH